MKESNVKCAVNKVLDSVVSDHKTGTRIILLTQGGPETLSDSDQMELQSQIVKHNIKLSTIVIPGKVFAFFRFLVGLIYRRSPLN